MVLVALPILCLMFQWASAAPDPNMNIKIDIKVNGKSMSESSENGSDNSEVKCGIETPSATRIINGETVNAALKYSWQIGQSAKDKPDTDYDCGGSMITPKHILTAAHCFHPKVPNELFIGIGSNDMKNPSIVIPMEKVFVHKDYDHPSKNNDIAIIELSKPIELFKNGIYPICLPADDSKDYTGLIGTVTGWGGTVGHNPEPTPIPDQEYPNILKEAKYPILDDDECLKQAGQFDKDKMLCASSKEGFESGGKGHCFGDSGGPFSVQYNGQHEQIGVVSWAVGCGSKGNPDFYTRVTNYLDWITEKIAPEKPFTVSKQ